MRNRTKLALVGLTAVLVLSISVTTASARRFEVSNTAFRAVFTQIAWGTELGTVTCPLTIEGSFHSRTISKVCGQLVGYITNAKATETEPPCRGGTFHVLNETLPWHVRYESFSGTLPTIEKIVIQITGLSILYTVGGVISCLLRSTAANPAKFAINLNPAGEATSLSALGEALIPLTGAGCAATGRYSGTSGPVTQLGTATTIRVRLVQ